MGCTLTASPTPAPTVHLTQLFDLSLIGRASRVGLEYAGEDGAVLRLRFGELDDRANRMADELAARDSDAATGCAFTSATASRSSTCTSRPFALV